MNEKRIAILGKALAFCLAAAVLFLSGCAANQPSITTKRWMIEYASPTVSPGPPLDKVLEVRRFTVSYAFRSQNMIYRPGPNQLDNYPYHKWWGTPSDLVGDLLLRDLQASGLFRAALIQAQRGQPRFVVEGGLEECLEVDLPSGWLARLSYNISVLDITQGQLPRRVRLQKTYTTEEPIQEKGPAGLARAMSRAAAKLSARAIADIYQAVKNTPKPKDYPPVDK